MQSEHGEPLTGRVLALGGYPSIGADIEVYVAGDMFHVMRYALQTQRIFANQKNSQSRMLVEKLTFFARQALEWATINNARALGLDDRTGSLTPGKQADIIVLRTEDLNLFPVNDPIQTAVFHAYGSNVDTVFVAGRKVKEDGKLLYPAKDLANKKHALMASGQRLMREGGLI
jgi:cytosine/adenosine deaminase-related metal-dependent hydrolase